MSARYWSAEVSVFLLNAAVEGERDQAVALIEEMTPPEAQRLLPDLVAIAATALRLLPPAALEAWRAQNRTFLAALPSPHGGS